MAEPFPKTLVEKWTFDDSIGSDVNSFSSRRHLFDFGIDSDLSLNENKVIPRLKEEFHYNISGLQVNLMKGINWAQENNRLIGSNQTDRSHYQKKLFDHFLQCLQRHNTIAEEEPTFVSISNTITYLFGALIRIDKTFFALKFRGVIYLLRQERENEFRPSDYQFLRFLFIATTRSVAEINGFERNLRVERIDLKDKSVIICKTIGANDRNGSSVYFKCRKKPKLELVWNHCAITGAQTFVHGIKLDERGRNPNQLKKSTLQAVNVIKIETIPQEVGSKCSPKNYFSYLDQSLDFIKSCVDSELVLFEFVIKRSHKSIDCFRHEPTDNSNHFLPEFYTQS